MVKVISIIIALGATGFLVALVFIALLIYNSATNQVVPLVYEGGFLTGTILFLTCAMLSSLIRNIEESTAV